MSGVDVGVLLARALARSADAAGVALAIPRAGWTRWASATFTGARHELELTLAADPATRRWLAALPEAELTVRGHLVADLKLVRSCTAAERLTGVIEVLTIEEVTSAAA